MATDMSDHNRLPQVMRGWGRPLRAAKGNQPGLKIAWLVCGGARTLVQWLAYVPNGWRNDEGVPSPLHRIV